MRFSDRAKRIISICVVATLAVSFVASIIAMFMSL